jgi:hypothetical protein
MQLGRLIRGLPSQLALILLFVSPAVASWVRLPGGPGAANTIRRECGECAKKGFIACGSANVQPGKRFARTAMQGKPPRGYLVEAVITGGEFRDLARKTASHQALVASIRSRFAAARLVVLEPKGRRARVLPPPESVDVIFPEPLYACVRDRAKPWGCCVGECGNECCEKDLGSPSVTLRWTDSEVQEEVAFKFHHMAGFSRLARRGGGREVLYYCLVDQAARLE